MEDKSLKERLAEIESSLTLLTEEPPKKSKLVRKIKTSTMKKKNNWVTIISINENKSFKIEKQQIKGQSVIVDSVPRLATGEYLLNFGREPVLIIPSWSVKPFTPSEDYGRSLADGSNTAGYRILLERMQSGVLAAKKKLSLGVGIGVLIIVGVVLYGVLA